MVGHSAGVCTPPGLGGTVWYGIMHQLAAEYGELEEELMKCIGLFHSQECML